MSDIRVTEHMSLRLSDRGEGVSPDITKHQILQLWKESVSVGTPHKSGTSRYHPEKNVIIMKKGNKLKTVLLPGDTKMNTDHLKECETCGEPYDPGETDSCPWH